MSIYVKSGAMRKLFDSIIQSALLIKERLDELAVRVRAVGGRTLGGVTCK